MRTSKVGRMAMPWEAPPPRYAFLLSLGLPRTTSVPRNRSRPMASTAFFDAVMFGLTELDAQDRGVDGARDGHHGRVLGIDRSAITAVPGERSSCDARSRSWYSTSRRLRSRKSATLDGWPRYHHARRASMFARSRSSGHPGRPPRRRATATSCAAWPARATATAKSSSAFGPRGSRLTSDDSRCGGFDELTAEASRGTPV